MYVLLCFDIWSVVFTCLDILVIILSVFIICVVWSAIVVIVAIICDCPMCPGPAIFSPDSHLRPCGCNHMLFWGILVLTYLVLLLHIIVIFVMINYGTCWFLAWFLLWVCWTVLLQDLRDLALWECIYLEES